MKLNPLLALLLGFVLWLPIIGSQPNFGDTCSVEWLPDEQRIETCVSYTDTSITTCTWLYQFDDLVYWECIEEEW